MGHIGLLPHADNRDELEGNTDTVKKKLTPTNSMQLSTTRKATSDGDTQEAPSNLWKPKVYYRIHKRFDQSLQSTRPIRPYCPIVFLQVNIIHPTMFYDYR
jgi:hypothetical protein